MSAAGKCFAVLIVAAASVVGLNAIAPIAAQPPKSDAKDAKAVDLFGLRDAVNAAAKRGANVDDIRAALDAFAKVAPDAKPGRVPPELQALRDAVDAAASKGENVEAIAKELDAVEMAVAGRSLSKPKPEPKPEPEPNPRPNPFPAFPAFPNVPAPVFPNPGGVGGGLGGGIDVQAFNKAMELRQKAMDLMLKNPRDPEAQKLLREANEAMLKAAGIGGDVAPLFPALPRVPDRARLGIRMERVPAVAAEQLGLAPNTGIVVSMVTPNSPAEKAGLKVHDIILEFAGKPVSDNLEDFIRRVSEVKAGEKVDIVLMRKGKKVEVKGVELPEAKPFGVRPAIPNVPLNPALPLNPARVRPNLPARNQPPGFGTVSYTNSNGAFSLKASKGDVRYTLRGTSDPVGKLTLTGATIEAGDKTQTADSLAKVPDAYRADVEQLLMAIEPAR